MAQIVTVKNGTTNEIQYPRTVKSALLNDDGTPLNPLTRLELDTKVDMSAIVNNLTTGGATNVLSAEQGKVINSAIGQIAVQKDEVKTTNFNPDGSITEVTKVGSTTIRTKTTTFPSATQIVETTVENGVTRTKTTTFNVDGTITEGVI